MGLPYMVTVSVNNWEVNKTVELRYPGGDKDHQSKHHQGIFWAPLHGGSGGIQDQDNTEVI